MTRQAPDDDYTAAEIDAEIALVERLFTVEEIFEQGYRAAADARHANAGVRSGHELAFRRWLTDRLERRQ